VAFDGKQNVSGGVFTLEGFVDMEMFGFEGEERISCGVGEI